MTPEARRLKEPRLTDRRYIASVIHEVQEQKVILDAGLAMNRVTARLGASPPAATRSSCRLSLG